MTKKLLSIYSKKKDFKRWTKGDNDRLYIQAWQLPFVETNWKKKDKKTLSLFGEELSYTKSSQLNHAQFYIDIKTGEIVTSIGWSKVEKEFKTFCKKLLKNASRN